MKRTTHDLDSDSGIAAARKLLRQIGPSVDHPLHVCAISLDLFDQTLDLHGLGDEERRVLAGAALLHDIGQSVGFAQHHKHSHDLILRAKLREFTQEEHVLIACVARYHRKAEPRPEHSLYGDLGIRAREVVNRLAALLRIADGLDRSQSGSVSAVSVAVTQSGVRIAVEQRFPSSVDIWGANRKRGLFERVFGLPVDVYSMGEGS